MYEGTRLSAAQELLRELMIALGAAGLSAAAERPGLLAAIDQHAASVRDAVGDGVRTPGPVSLAGYAEGLIQTATRAGWRLPTGSGVDWVRADWRAVRLVAICALGSCYI